MHFVYDAVSIQPTTT